MNLISCEKCAVVIDLHRIFEPYIRDYDTQEVISENAGYRNGEWEPVIQCPVCGTKIFYEDGEMIN
jgi:hypothetical protein